MVRGMQKVTAITSFRSPEPLTEVGLLLSERLFGGIPFVSTDAYDEVPALTLSTQVLGLRVDLLGDGGSYQLRLGSVYAGDTIPNYLRMDEYLEQLLHEVEGISRTDPPQPSADFDL
jgi:hypothetical protein